MKKGRLSLVAQAGLVLLAALMFCAPAPAQAQEQADDYRELLECPPDTDGTLEYRARYLKADWVQSEIPGEPDLVIALLARVVNRSRSAVKFPNPFITFHKSMRVRYTDGSLVESKTDVFPPPPGGNALITLGPNESMVFGQGVVTTWKEAHTHQVVDKELLVIGEIKNRPPAEKGEESAGGMAEDGPWTGCIESRIGDVAFPPVSTDQRYHPGQSLDNFVQGLREKYHLP